MVRIIVIGLLIYAGHKIWKWMSLSKSPKTEVHGRPRKTTLDIDSSNVEDAKFEDIDDSSGS
ncbi:MAG TPA: hypothetical protein ENN03_09885 [bacterium]|nr:hypothetical protein [bacterium]